MNFREWFLENTVSQTLKSNPDLQQKYSVITLPEQFANLPKQDQDNLKKWLVVHSIDPSQLQGMDVLLDPTDKFQARKKLNKLGYTINDLRRDNESYHKSLETEKERVYTRTVRKLDLPPINGLQWVSLDKEYCELYGQSMGHCGNEGKKPGDNILSLMDDKNVHYLTFIVNKGVLGEMKGRNNQKPPKEFHPNIIQLLKSPYVDTIVGLGYKPENNFQLEDLTSEQQQDVLRVKPNIDNYAGHLGKDYAIVENDIIFNKNLSNQQFVELASVMSIDNILLPSLAANFKKRGIEVPDIVHKIILQYPYLSYLYAEKVNFREIPKEIVQSIAKKPINSYYYAIGINFKNVPQEIIDSVAEEPQYSLWYAQELKFQNIPQEIIKGVTKDPQYSFWYAQKLNFQNIPQEIIDSVAENTKYAYSYARELDFKNVPKEIIETIARNKKYAYLYAQELDFKNVPELIRSAIQHKEH